MFKGLADLLEKLPTVAIRSGLTVAVIGIALDLAIHFGVVEEAALYSLVSEAAPVLWVSGLAMISAGALIALPSLLRELRRWWLRVRHRREEISRLLGNTNFLDEDGALLLFLILKLPNYRMEAAAPHLPFERLQELNLIEPEAPFDYHARGGRGFVRLSPLIRSKRNQLIAELSIRLSSKFKLDVNDRMEFEKVFFEMSSRREKSFVPSGRRIVL